MLCQINKSTWARAWLLASQAAAREPGGLPAEKVTRNRALRSSETTLLSILGGGGGGANSRLVACPTDQLHLWPGSRRTKIKSWRALTRSYLFLPAACRLIAIELQVRAGIETFLCRLALVAPDAR